MILLFLNFNLWSLGFACSSLLYSYSVKFSSCIFFIKADIENEVEGSNNIPLQLRKKYEKLRKTFL